MNKDRMNNVPVIDVARAAMSLLNVAQDLKPEEFVPAYAASFLLVCERYGLKPQEVFTAASNIMNYAQTRRPEFRAVDAFVRKELP